MYKAPLLKSSYLWVFLIIQYLSEVIIAACSDCSTHCGLRSLSYAVTKQCNDISHFPSASIYANISQKKCDRSLSVLIHPFSQVAAYNSEGKSNPSQVVEFITKPDRPSCPCRPVIRGRVLPNSFKMAWGEHLIPVALSLITTSQSYMWLTGQRS